MQKVAVAVIMICSSMKVNVVLMGFDKSIPMERIHNTSCSDMDVKGLADGCD